MKWFSLVQGTWGPWAWEPEPHQWETQERGGAWGNVDPGPGPYNSKGLEQRSARCSSCAWVKWFSLVQGTWGPWAWELYLSTFCRLGQGGKLYKSRALPFFSQLIHVLGTLQLNPHCRSSIAEPSAASSSRCTRSPALRLEAELQRPGRKRAPHVEPPPSPHISVFLNTRNA